MSETGTVEGITLAELVLHRDEVVHEDYAPSAGPDTTLISWSTAKSVTQASVEVRPPVIERLQELLDRPW